MLDWVNNCLTLWDLDFYLLTILAFWNILCFDDDSDLCKLLDFLLGENSLFINYELYFINVFDSYLASVFDYYLCLYNVLTFTVLLNC
jgi:hypothetical protein